MNKTKKLQDGQEVVINIPFTYYIGDDGYFTNKTLETIEDCKKDLIAELESGQRNFAELYMKVKIHPING